MGIEDGLGEAADQAKKIVTGTDEDKQNKEDQDPDMEDASSYSEGLQNENPLRNIGNG